MIPLLLTASEQAEAHRPGLSFARIEENALFLTFASPELTPRFQVDPIDVDALAKATLLRARVEVGGKPCQLAVASAKKVSGDGIEIGAAMTCPVGKDWTFEAPYLADFAPGHRQYVEAFGQAVGVLDVTSASVGFSGPGNSTSSGATVAVEFFELGIEHILTGVDHLAFLLGLLLAARGLREMAAVVSGFTVAHSITLALAALQVVHISPAIVEPAIALSIAFVAVENFFEPPVKRRVAITFALGLIHGFGFAGVLQELGLPTGQLVVALVSFNVGVEAGQLAVVLPILPLLIWLREKEAWRTYGVRGVSILLAVAGAIWFVSRILQSF